MKQNKQNMFSSFWHSDTLLLSTLYCLCAFALSFTAFRMLFVQHKVFGAVCAAAGGLALMFLLFYRWIVKSGGAAKTAEKVRKNKPVFIALLLASVITLFTFAVYTLSPLGDYTVLRMDLYHQYGPLFAELYDKIVEGKSLLYSWNSAGGSGFMGNYFNYLSSPFTLLIFWFSRREVVTTAISFIVFAKCIASAGTFAYYLKKRPETTSLSIASFSLLYAFSAYFIAYFWNVMWLDAMLIFPLVMLGIEHIIDHSRAKLYFFGLCYAFLTNYYMAYMLCIFSVLYFITYYVSHYQTGALYVPKTPDMPRFSKLRQSRFLCAGARFAFASVFAVLCCAAVLLPVYRILSGSSATDDTFPTEAKSYFDMFDFIAAHLSTLEPTIRSSGDNVTPNVYCGIFTILLLPLYMMSKRISWKEKLSHLLLLILLYVCFNFNYLNFIWHGFHFPNDLPYRFSFMYSFVLLICAFKVFRYIRDYDYKTLIIVGGVFALVCAIVQKYNIQYVDDNTIYISLAFILVYTLIICAAIAGKLSKVMLSAVLCCAVICEVLICDVPKFEFGVTESDYVSDYSAYRKAIETVEKKDDGFYRIELNDIPTELRMSPCWYNYEGINCFSSMANKSYASMQHALGNFSNDINSFMYHNQTPIYNLMFNIKYVIDNSNPLQLNKAYYRYLSGNSESLTTYRNNYPSSIAFCVNREVLKGWNTDDLLNCFELQSNFLNMASGVDKPMFEKVKIFTNGAQNCSITSFENEGDGSMSFSVFNSENSASFDTDFTADATGNYYIYWGASNKFAKSEIQTESYSKTQEIGSNPYLLDLGVLQKGEEVNIKTFIDEDVAEGSGYLWAYRLDEDAFREAYDILADEGMMQVSEQSDRLIKGTVTAQKNEILYTSIAYDSGWECYVDGTQVKPYRLNNSLLALEVGSGTHTVEFRFTPSGLKTGLLISGICLGAIALFYLIKKALIILIRRATDAMLNQENA